MGRYKIEKTALEIDAERVARWFVTSVLHERYDESIHRHQSRVALALLDQGYTSADIEGAVAAVQAGALETTNYTRTPLYSLAFLTSRVLLPGKGPQSPLSEYAHARKVRAYQTRPAALAALSAREGAFFAVAK